MEYMRKHTTEFSKVILFAISAVLLIVIIFSMVMMAITSDLTPLDWILGGLFSLADVAVAFYYWKARKENEIKLRVIYGKEMADGTETNDETDVECVG